MLTLVENKPFVPVGKGLLSRFSSRDKASGTKGGPFCPAPLTGRDKRATTWQAQGARGSPPFVPVGNTDRDKRPSTWRTQDAERLGFRAAPRLGFRGGVRQGCAATPFVPYFTFQKNYIYMLLHVHALYQVTCITI